MTPPSIFPAAEAPTLDEHAATELVSVTEPVPLLPLQNETEASVHTVEPDPLDFVLTTEADAVKRINNEYFFRRDSSEICRQNASTGEIQIVTPQQQNTALAGRWVEDAVDPKTGKMKTRDAAAVWRESRARREVHGVQYCPNNIGLRQRHLNLWYGWGVDAVVGDCSIVLDHIQQVIAGGDDRKAAFVLDWFADIIQNPTRKPGVALVFRGKEGTGKTVPGMILRRLLHPRNVLINSDKDRLFGKHRTALASKILILAEESFFSGDAKTNDALKHLVTGETLEVEPKFGRDFEIESHHRLLMTSNHTQVIDAAAESRRWVACDVADARRGDIDYFGRLYAVSNGSDDVTAQAFMHHLLNRDLSKFLPWAAQQEFRGDKALVDQKVLSLAPPLTWLWEVLSSVADRPPGKSTSGNWLNGLPIEAGWLNSIPRSRMLQYFREWTEIARPRGASTFTASDQRFWSEITKVIPPELTRVKDANGNRCVTIPLDDLQACFQAFLRGESSD